MASKKKSSWIIDEDGLVECDCGVTGFQVIVDTKNGNEVVHLNCISCGADYAVEEFKTAVSTKAAAKEERR